MYGQIELAYTHHWMATICYGHHNMLHLQWDRYVHTFITNKLEWLWLLFYIIVVHVLCNPVCCVSYSTTRYALYNEWSCVGNIGVDWACSHVWPPCMYGSSLSLSLSHPPLSLSLTHTHSIQPSESDSVKKAMVSWHLGHTYFITLSHSLCYRLTFRSN